MKGIDAVTRDQLVQVMAVLGLGNAAPIFSMVPTLGPFKPAALIPSVTEEDRVILNNVEMIAEFLTGGSITSRTSNQVLHLSCAYKISIFCTSYHDNLQASVLYNSFLYFYLLVYHLATF